jgi:small-conductance mechanosensitive channel
MILMTLQNFLSAEWLGVPASLWLKALITATVVLGGLMLVRLVLVKRLKALAKYTTTDVDDLAVDLLSRTRFFFLVAVSVAAGWSAVGDPPPDLKALDIVVGLAIFIQAVIWSNGLITYWVSRFTSQQSESGVSNAAIVTAMGGVVRVVVAVGLLLMCIHLFVTNVTPLIAGLGIMGIAVALAVQNILSDLFSAVSILVDKPFQIGDFIVVDEMKGTVEYIGMKSTRVRALGGEQIIYSNADLLSSRVRNFKRMQERRVLLKVGVVYQTPPAQLARIPAMIRAIVESHEPVRFERSHFLAFADSWLEFETVFWVLSPEYIIYADIQQSINLALVRKFEEEGLSFAYPTRTLFLEKEQPPQPAAAAAAQLQQ